MNEFICFVVLVGSTGTLSIMQNFIGLVIIADFEEFLYLSLRDEPVKHLLCIESFEDVCLTIARTSSRHAKN
jgi:hypothetical protein